MRVCVVWVCTTLLAAAMAAPATEHNSRTFRNALNQQGLQSILQSIEERLRNLDHIYAIRYSSRPELNIDQYSRKIDILETKLSRLESILEAQMEKISENMSSKNFKDDIAKDQIFRKIDSAYERLNHKLIYVEGKLDMDVLKLQSKIEAGITKIERLDHSISVRQADMEAEISDGVEMMLHVKDGINSIENKVVNVTKRTLDGFHEKQANSMTLNVRNMTTEIATHLGKKLNATLEQCNNHKNFPNDFSNNDTPFTKTFKDYEDKIFNYENKVTNMYNELWKKSINIENSIKNSVQVTNLTRREMQDNMNNLLKQFRNEYANNDCQNDDGTLEIILDSFSNMLQRKISELTRKLEANFQNVLLAQNLFLESCHRIQMDESQLENKISLVLEKLLEAFTNKSSATFREIQSMEEMIKSHDAHVYRSINQNTNTVIRLSEKTSEDRKKIEKILSTIKLEIGKILASVQDVISSESDANYQKLDTVANTLQELQEQVNDLDNRMSEDNMNYSTKQIQQDILLQMKDLFSKDSFAQQLNTTAEKLMENIYGALNSIDSKLGAKINSCPNHTFSEFSTHKFGNSHLNNTVINKEGKNIIHNDTNAKTATNVEFSSEQNHENSEENVDVILEIFPESYLKKNNITDTTGTEYLRRFNYTIISEEAKVPLPTFSKSNSTEKIFFYANSDALKTNSTSEKEFIALNDIAQVSTLPPLHAEDNSQRDNGSNETILVQEDEGKPSTLTAPQGLEKLPTSNQETETPITATITNYNSENIFDPPLITEVPSSEIFNATDGTRTNDFGEAKGDDPGSKEEQHLIDSQTTKEKNEKSDMWDSVLKMFSIVNQQDSFEYVDLKNGTNGFADTTSDPPDLNDYDEDYDEQPF